MKMKKIFDKNLFISYENQPQVSIEKKLVKWKNKISIIDGLD